MPEGHVVLCKELAGQAETAVLFYVRGAGYPVGAEEDTGFVFPHAVLLVARADTAVLHADLPVPFGIFNSDCSGFHTEVIVQPQDKRFLPISRRLPAYFLFFYAVRDSAGPVLPVPLFLITRKSHIPC